MFRSDLWYLYQKKYYAVMKSYKVDLYVPTWKDCLKSWYSMLLLVYIMLLFVREFLELHIKIWKWQMERVGINYERKLTSVYT